jgi:N-acyl-L-homoserine lactone synthetase
MVLVLDATTSFRHSAVRQDMHRVRKVVFVDRLQWRVPVVDGEYEIDEYDAGGAVYLIAVDRETGEHLASVRLLPSTEPHILGDFYDSLCEGGAPRCSEVWEISRLCATPGLPRDRELRARHKISTALIEYGLLHGITRYTCVLNVEWLPTLLAPGWPCEPLGPPKSIAGELLGAFAISISAATLQAFLGRWGGSFPVLEFPGRKAA